MNTEALDEPSGDIEDLRGLVWLPGEFAAAGMDDIALAQADGTRWLNINVPKLGDYVAPVRAGQLVSLIGQTSHGKSLLLHYLEYKMAQQLKKENRSREAIFHVSVEVPIEDMAMLALARRSGNPVSLLSRGEVIDVGKLQAASTEVSGTPIVYVGESIRGKRSKSGMIDSMNLTNVFNAIRDICVQTDMTAAMIAIDYLQALPIDPRLASTAEPINQRRLQVRADTYFTRRAGMFFGCPMFMGVQAKQVLGSGPKKDSSPSHQQPGMYDGEESASIAQRSDRILTTWMPARSYPVGTVVSLGAAGSETISVEDDMLLVKVAKQRGFLPAGKTFMFRVAFETGEMTPEEL